MDVFSPAKRSDIMSRIRGKGNIATEIAVVNLFKQNSISGWRRHQKLPGTPDFTFWKQRTAVFVDGCYWHGCPRCKKTSKTNVKFWSLKFKANKLRDRRVTRELRLRRWHVIRVWQCQLKKPAAFLSRLRRALNSPRPNGSF